jgi:Family of unknown function (DUF5309)
MPALLEPELVGKRQDLSDYLYVSDRKTTPGITSIKKGERLSNMLYDFIVKSFGARKKGGVPDGKDVNAFDAQSPKRQLQARGEVFRRAPMVGFIAQEMSLAGGVAGTPNLMNEAKADQLVEHKRDIEKELWSNQDSRPDDGVNGSQFRGMGRWIYNGASTLTLDPADLSPSSGYFELPVPADARTPANQIYTGSVGSMTQAQFDALIQAKYENTGASSDLRGFVTPIIKNRVGFFSRYQPDVTSYTSRVFVSTGFLEGKTLFGATVDVYKSDWGTFELFPVLTDFMPTPYTAFFLDMDQPRIRSAGTYQTESLPDFGGGPRNLIQSILSLFPGDPRAHCKIDGTA